MLSCRRASAAIRDNWGRAIRGIQERGGRWPDDSAALNNQVGGGRSRSLRSAGHPRTRRCSYVRQSRPPPPPLPPPLPPPPPPPLPSLRPPPPPTAIGKLSGLGVKRGHERDLAPPLTRGGGGASGVVILPNAIEALASPVLEQNKSWAGEHLCFFSCR